MQLDQKKKIFLMAGALGLLLVGFVIFFLGGKTPQEQADAPSPPPAPTGAASPATGTPSGAAPVTPAPGAAAPPATAPRPSPPSTSTTVASTATGSGWVDPFAGGLGRDVPVTERVVLDRTPVIPVIAIPGVSASSKAGTAFPAGGGSKPEENNSTDDDFFFGAEQTPTREANLGHNAGWVSFESRGKVVAYFQMKDGTLQAVRVGTVVNGWRVRAIDKTSLVLVDDVTGREQTVQLVSAQAGDVEARGVAGRASAVQPLEWN